jgi:hypothetical protein
MNHTDKDTKIEFAPGCFDGFEGTQEELAELMAEIRNMVANGTLFENSTPVDDEEAEEVLKMVADKEKRQ